MDEDLLTTNNINNADLNTFSQIKNRSSNVYDNNKPEFLKDKNNIIQNETINDSSIGYDQFKKFEMESSKNKKKFKELQYLLIVEIGKKHIVLQKHLLN